MSRYAAVCRHCGYADDFTDPDCPYSCIVGWDARRDTYFCQVEDLFMHVADDEDESKRLVLWVGQGWQEVRSVAELEAAIAEWCAIQPEDREALERDKAEQWYQFRGSDIYVQLADDEVSGDPAMAALLKQGIRWARLYSAEVPEGEYGQVHDDELKPVNTDTVEKAMATWPEPLVMVRPLPQVGRRGWLGPA